MKRIFTAVGARNVSLIKLSIFELFAALLIVFGSAADAFAQEGNKYEEPWHPAARFAVKEGGKREKATITLVKLENAEATTSEAGMDFKICLQVTVKKGRKKAVKQYVQTDVFRDDKTMAYTLKSWALFKTPPDFCK